MPRFQLQLNVIAVVRRDSVLLLQALCLADQYFDDHEMLIAQVVLFDVCEPLGCRRVCSTSSTELVACMHLALDEALAMAKTLFKSIEIRYLLFVEWLST